MVVLASRDGGSFPEVPSDVAGDFFLYFFFGGELVVEVSNKTQYKNEV